jgi:uncharacterized phage protein (TIGR02218 family)
MKTNVSSELLAHLAGEVTTIAYCWVITRSDAEIFRFTDHDEDITVLGHDYMASAAMGSTDLKQNRSLAVDNMEAIAFLDSELITDADLRAGLFDGATVDLFLVNWSDPSMGILEILTGWSFGQVEIRDSACTVEIRGLGQKLSRNICELYSETCRAQFGDAQCGFDLSSSGMTQTGASAGSEAGNWHQRFYFWPGLDVSDDKLVGGVLTWSPGTANAGLSMEIKSTNESPGEITLLLPMPNPIGYADEFTVVRACDKKIETCITVFDNALNFRGEPWVPPAGKVRIYHYPRMEF